MFGCLLVDFYSGMICSLECRRHNKRTKSQLTKTVTLAVGGRYDKLVNKFSRNRSEVFDGIQESDATNDVGESRPKAAVGVSFEIEKLSRFVVEDYADRVSRCDQSTSPSLQQLIQTNAHHLSPLPQTLASTTQPLPLRYWPLDIAIYSLTQPKSKAYLLAVCAFIKQLRDRGLMCNEIIPSELSSYSLSTLTSHCLENRIPYLITVKCHSTATTAGDDFLQPPSATSVSPNASSSSSGSNRSNCSSVQACLATLYQLDRSRLREIKRCDIPTMIELLAKRLS